MDIRPFQHCHEALMHARTMGYKVIFTDYSLYGFADVGSIHVNKVLQFTLADIDYVCLLQARRTLS
jgi:phosphatidylinositol glycan class A protein